MFTQTVGPVGEARTEERRAELVAKFGRNVEFAECIIHCISPDVLQVQARLFTGATLADREQNGYDDSDFYAYVWNADTQAVERYCYASTRGWSYDCGCVVDATPEVKAAAREAAYVELRRSLAEKAVRDHNQVAVGKTVEVVRGRKYAGRTGRVTWMGKSKFDRHVDCCRVQPADDSAPFYINADYCLVTDELVIDEEAIDRQARYYAERRY